MKLLILLSTIFIFLLTLQFFAQEKPRALKFDEFQEPTETAFVNYQDEMSLTERGKRFGAQLRKQPGATAYIIYYRGRITESSYSHRLKNKLDRIRWEIRPPNDYANETVKIINGGFRERTTIEFWIVPKTAEPPVPTPTIDESETVVCPNVGVWGESIFNEDDALLFSFSEYDLKETPDYSFKWKISGGEIVGEQDLSEVKIKLNDGVKRATAYLEINGLPFPCPKVFSATAAINGKLYQIDDFGREPNGQIRSRLDNFATKLFENPTARGYVINYGSRREGKKILEMRDRLIKSHFAFRSIDTSRLTFIDGGYREDVATELWLSFDENEKPVPTPTVDARFVGVSGAPKKSVRRKAK